MRVFACSIGLLVILVLACSSTESDTTPEPAPATVEPQIITYTVQAGDTLALIAKRYDIPLADLVTSNNIENPDLIEVGLVLTITLSAKGDGSSEAPAAGSGVITTADGDQIPCPGTAYMDGRDPEADPPLTLMQINIWGQVPRVKTVCRLFHGDEVQVTASKWMASESRYYFQLKKGGCEGWVSEPFLSAEPHEPIGDEFW